MPAVGWIRSVLLEVMTVPLSTEAAGSTMRTSSAKRMSYELSCEMTMTACVLSVTKRSLAVSTPALAVSHPAGCGATARSPCTSASPAGSATRPGT